MFSSISASAVKYAESGATVGSAYALSGNRGVRLPAKGDHVYMTTVYDPWITPYSTNQPVQIEIPGMDTSYPTLHVFAYYRHPDEDTTGGVRNQYRSRFLQYDGSWCKRVGYLDRTQWSGLLTMLPRCYDEDLIWTACDRSVAIDNSVTNDATIFRAYVRSTSSAAVYIDKVGVYGGTSP